MTHDEMIYFNFNPRARARAREIESRYQFANPPISLYARESVCDTSIRKGYTRFGKCQIFTKQKKK